MPVRLVTTAVVAAALLACGRGGEAPRGERAERPARAEADGPPTRAAPEAGRASEGRAAVRRGDRHARAAARQSPTVKRVEGTVARTGERQIVIRPSGEPELTLRIAPSTTVTVDGRPTRLAALREGVEVRASYETGGGGRPTALTIEARAPKRGADRSAETSPDPVPGDAG